MRITYLGHASYIIESKTTRIVTDPWLVDPIFDGRVRHDFRALPEVKELGRFDAIALSHGHLDHFNAPALAQFTDKSIPVIHPLTRFSELDDNLQRLGFDNLQPTGDWETEPIGDIDVTPTPAFGVEDECAFHFRTNNESFWNGIDAPQPPPVIREIRERLGPVDVGALSHNSFDQPSLFGLGSFKDAGHGPKAACESARALELRVAIPSSSSMEWTGTDGEELTQRVIRKTRRDLMESLAQTAPDIDALLLCPGQSWSLEGGPETSNISLADPATHVSSSDYIHTFLDTGESHCDGRSPSTEEIFCVHFPALCSKKSEASSFLGQRVVFDIVGDDSGCFGVDFTHAPFETWHASVDEADFALRITDEDLKALFSRQFGWQSLMVSDRLRVLKVNRGEPPLGLHFVYALQWILP